MRVNVISLFVSLCEFLKIMVHFVDDVMLLNILLNRNHGWNSSRDCENKGQEGNNHMRKSNNHVRFAVENNGLVVCGSHHKAFAHMGHGVCKDSLERLRISTVETP